MLRFDRRFGQFICRHAGIRRYGLRHSHAATRRLICDVGANVGAYTILASAVSGARSVAFEPVSSTYAWLLQNIRLNGVADKVVARHEAVGAEIGPYGSHRISIRSITCSLARLIHRGLDFGLADVA